MVEDSKKKKDIVETAKKRFKIGYDADSENRKEALEDMRFRAGDQWPDQVKNQRVIESRPCLTINKIPQNIHQITNDQRQNRPSILVDPVDDAADVDTAEVLQGIIRNIENNSNADTAYDIGFDAAVTGGRGYFRIITEYCDPESFDQEIKIKPIHNPHSVVLDPNYKEPDGSDANWGFIIEDIPKDDFKARYPNAEINSETFNWDQALISDWFSEENVKVAEYFERVFVKEKLYLLEDGSTVLESDIKGSDYEISEEELSKLKSRDTQVPKIKWYVINGEEILEETEWSSRWIPIIPIHGEELWVDGKRVFEGIVRHARDPQRMYNYWATCETETIALTPKAPYIVAEGQIEGHKEIWNDAHLKSFPYLPYKPTSLSNGQPAPPPQRNFGEAPVQAITQARMLASDDLKSTTGIYDASLGNRSSEQSGVAITRRTQQSQTGNFHFVDNLSRSIRHGGRILIDLIPKIYDTERAVRIIGPEDDKEIITVNGIFTDEDGNEKAHQLDLGKYDCVVTTGPSFATKRQEAADSMLKMSQHNPQIAQVAGDLMIKNMDWPGAPEISERIKRTIPPDILGEKEEEQLPPQIMAQMEQMNGVIQQMGNELQVLEEKLKDKSDEIQSKERIEFAKIQKDIDLAQLKIEAQNGSSDDLAALAQEILTIKNSISFLLNPTSGDSLGTNLGDELPTEE